MLWLFVCTELNLIISINRIVVLFKTFSYLNSSLLLEFSQNAIKNTSIYNSIFNNFIFIVYLI